jgi:asparagine synthase (glutamine-hydrolysing)
MCGICGYLDDEARLDPGVIERMTHALAHRGPDAHHTVVDEPVHLGASRLAVIDPGSHGDQPMGNADGSLRLVFNGEIYNHADHRRRLEAQGRRFRTRTDTEVILHLYEELGDACVAELRGMFAFALWDRPRRRLLLARDPFGEKPLYFCAAGGRFVFASEIKALLQNPTVPRDLDPAALHDFLAFDYVPGPGTVFSGISQLPPGHLMVVDRDGVSTRRYWQPSFRPHAGPMDVAAAAAEIRARLSESLRRRLMADVPLGVFLSGGLDSSAMVALLRAAGDAPIHTFALGFAEPDRDERPHARVVAEAFGTVHHEFLHRPDVAADLPAIVAHFDQPFGDPSVLPTWELSQAAREHVTVVLTGEGGDESFAGYDRYVKNALAASWYRLPRGLRGGSSALFDALFARAPHDRLTRRLQEFFALGELPPDELFCRWLLRFDRELERRVHTEDFLEAAGGRDSGQRIRELYHRSDAADPVNAMLDVDVRSYLADDLLVKLDMATMRHSVEGRCPYLDQELFEFVASLPGRLKLRRFKTKWILRRALRDVLPRSILERPKAGFGPPVHRWLRGGLRDLAFDTLTDSRALGRGYFRPQAVRELLEEHTSGRRNHGHQLWNLLVFELWQRAVVDGSPRAVEVPTVAP